MTYIRNHYTIDDWHNTDNNQDLGGDISPTKFYDLYSLTSNYGVYQHSVHDIINTYHQFNIIDVKLDFGIV